MIHLPYWPQLGSWLRLQRRVSGLGAITFIIVLRLLGWLQPLEWRLYDFMLKWRPAEATDGRITIVAIDEPSLQQLESYPIPDAKLAEIIQEIQRYQPRAIAIDLFRDQLTIGQGAEPLAQAFGENANVFGIYRLAPPAVSPHAALPPERAGFVDQVPDSDSFLRRNLLGSFDDKGDFFLSLTVMLAGAYLAPEGIELSNGIRDPDAMRFGSLELRSWSPYDGGYVRADMAGYQIPIRFRSGPAPFEVISLEQLLANQVSMQQIEDRIVLLGATAPSLKDIVNSAAVTSENPGLVSGVEVQAHAISQILSAVLDGRPLLTVWPNSVEYAWIVCWGLLGMLLGRLSRSPGQQFLSTACLGIGLTGLGYLLLLGGLWIPVIPAVLVFGINGIFLYTFYLYDQSLRQRIEEREQLIDRTYDEIHAGALQRLADLLRRTRSGELTPEKSITELDRLNREIRQVFDNLRRESPESKGQLRLEGGYSIPVQQPLHQMLYQVYTRTLEREEFPNFALIRAKIVKFELMDETGLDLALKKDMGRFLEEALCNVGKHAAGVKRITVVCMKDGDRNLIRVADNGKGSITTSPKTSAQLPPAQFPSAQSPSAQPFVAVSNAGGRGTEQAIKLAKQLSGKFQRRVQEPQGMHCELSWPVRRAPLILINQEVSQLVRNWFGRFRQGRSPD